MGTAASNTTLEGVIDQVYPREVHADELYATLPEVALATKKEFAGRKHVVRVKVAGQAGRSVDYEKATDNKTSSSWEEFEFTDFNDYGTGGVDNKTILTIGSNLSEFKDVVKEEMSSSKDAFMRSVANALYGQKNGALGRIKSGGTTDTLVLYDRSQAKFFQIGQTLKASGDPAAVSPDRAGTATVLKVDPITGTIVLDAAEAAWVNDDYLYVDGDFRAKPPGFFQLCPESLTPGEDFYGVDRTKHRLLLAGTWFDHALGGDTDEVVRAAIAFAKDCESDVDTMFMNPIRFQALCESIMAKSNLVQGTSKSPDRPHVGINSVSFAGGKSGKTINVVESLFCPYDYSPLLKIEDLELAYRGKDQGRTFPDYYDLDGSKVRLSREKKDQTEWQLYGYYVFCMRRPKNLMMVRFKLGHDRLPNRARHAPQRLHHLPHPDGRRRWHGPQRRPRQRRRKHHPGGPRASAPHAQGVVHQAGELRAGVLQRRLRHDRGAQEGIPWRHRREDGPHHRRLDRGRRQESAGR